MRSGWRLICIISNAETADAPDSGQALLKSDEATIHRTIWSPRIFRAALADGDTLIVTKLDRLARSTKDLLNTLDAIGKAGATFKSLGDPWADIQRRPTDG